MSDEHNVELTGDEEHNTASMKRDISYAPTAGLSYNPSDDVYWDADALALEVTRAFEICSGCRMCFKYCDSFPSLFTLVDDVHNGDVTKLNTAETNKVMDDCFQCKLCEVQCPYTPRDDHEFQLDFPKLVHRYQAQRKKKEGFTLRNRLLGDPDMSATMARASLGLVNVMNRVSLHRVFFEKVVGVHRKKLLPMFAQETFTSWAKKNNRTTDVPRGNEAVLFQTCFVDGNEPQIGKDTLTVLDKNQVKVDCVPGLVCCGMPKWEHGDIEGLRKNAKKNLDVLMPFVDAGQTILAINPTCSMMFRREYAELVAPEDKVRAEKLAAATMDPSEYLWSIRKEERFNTDFKSSPGDKVAYHAPCHLRAQAKGFKARDLLKKIPGVTPSLTMECCGHDGTYAMTVEGFEPSIRIGQKAFDGMKEAESEVWATDCPLAAVQFAQHAGRTPLHPMTILARAYDADGFEQKIQKELPPNENDKDTAESPT